MCIGLPVQVIEDRGFTALCRGRNGEEEVNMMLIGPQPVGTWIVNFLGSGREVLTDQDAELINQAFDGLAAVMNGESAEEVERYFPDLIPAKTA